MLPTTSWCEDEDGYSSISGPTLEKARRELNEEPATRAEVVQELRAKIIQRQVQMESERHLDFKTVSSGRKDGPFLLRFLRARKFDVEKATQLYINYYKYRRKFSHLLTDFHPCHVQDVIKAGIFGVLDHKLSNDSRVLCVLPARWDYGSIPPNGPYKTFLLILEKLLEDEEVQVHGISVFDNMADMSWHVTYSFAWCEHIQHGALVELQDSFPIRFKGFHMLNQPWYLSMVMRIVRPFLRQKHRDRIQAHGEDTTALYELIHPTNLPSNFGGDAPELGPDNLMIFFERELSLQSVSIETVSIQSGGE